VQEEEPVLLQKMRQEDQEVCLTRSLKSSCVCLSSLSLKYLVVSSILGFAVNTLVKNIFRCGLVEIINLFEPLFGE